MSAFRYPTPVVIGSTVGGGGGNTIQNSTSSSSITVGSPSNSSGAVSITTNAEVALTIDDSQNVIIGYTPPSSAPLPTRTTIGADDGQCLQLINTISGTSAIFSANAYGGLTIATTLSNIYMTSNRIYIDPSSLYIGSGLVTSTATQLNYVATTPGTAQASKALVVDDNNRIVGLTHLSTETLTGTLLTAAQPNITSLDAVNISTLRLQGDQITSTAPELNYLHNTVPAVATANKAFVFDSSLNISNINSLTATALNGTIQTASQPNITSVGTLEALSLSGSLGIGTTEPSRSLEIVSGTPAIRLNDGSHIAELLIDANGNLRFNSDRDIAIKSHVNMVFSGTSQISGLSVLDVAAIAGLIQTASQPNITTVGTLDSLTVAGDLILGAGADLSINHRLIITEQSGNCLQLFRSNTAKCSLQINANGDLVIEPTRHLRIVSGVSIYMAGAIYGVSDLTAQTLTGELLTASQPNVTSLGTLSSLTVTNGINASAITASAITGTLQTGSQPNITTIGTLSSLAVSGTISASSVTSSALTGTLQTASQPNITTIGTLSSLTVSGSISASSVAASTITGALQTASQPNITTIGALSNLIVNNDVSASSITATTISGALQTASQPNVTSLGTLSSLTVTNGINASAITASAITGTLQTASQPSITSVGNLTSLSVVGAVSASDITASTLTGTIQTASQPNITTIGALTRLTVDNAIGVGVSSPTSAIDIDTSSLNTSATIRMTDGTNSVSFAVGALGLTINTSGSFVTLGTDTGLRFTGGTLIGLSSLSATEITGTIQTASQPNITQIGTTQYLDTGRIGLGCEHDSIYRINILDSNGKFAMLSDGTNSLILTTIGGVYTINTNSDRIALGTDVSLLLNGGTILGLEELTAAAITGTLQTAAQPNITSTGTLASLTVSGAANLESSASVGGDLVVAGDLTIEGELILSTPLTYASFSSLTASFTSDIDATSSTSGGTLTVTGGAAFSRNVFIGETLTIGSSVLTSANAGLLNGVVPGTVTPGSLLATNVSGNLSGFNTLSATNVCGTIRTATQPYITTVGNLANLNVTGYLGVGTTAPLKQLEINSSTGDCLRLSYDKPSNTAYTDITVDATGNATITPSGGGITISAGVTAPRLTIGNTTNATIPLEIGFVPFVFTSAYAYNTAANGHGICAANSASYNYSIRAQGRILCTQSVDVTSDRRLKKNIEELSDDFCSSFVEKTTPVRFNWKEGEQHPLLGYIAQDLLRTGFGELVNLTPDDKLLEEIDDDGFLNPAGLKFSVTIEHIIPILAKNQKRIMRENRELREKLDAIMAMLQK